MLWIGTDNRKGTVIQRSWESCCTIQQTQ